MSLAERLEQKGLEKGEAKGRVEGRAEERTEIARNMLAQNTDLSFVAKVTGLSVDELQQLSEKGNG